jgi:polyisoprenoid-binding protein YceI
MLGVTREVTLPVAILGRGTHPESGLPIAGLETEFTIRLSDFNMNKKTDAAVILGDQIKFKLKTVGVGSSS